MAADRYRLPGRLPLPAFVGVLAGEFLLLGESIEPGATLLWLINCVIETSWVGSDSRLSSESGQGILPVWC